VKCGKAVVFPSKVVKLKGLEKSVVKRQEGTADLRDWE